MTFEYDAFKDAVYISSQAAKDLGIDEIIYHPKNHEFSFFNKSTMKLLKDKLKETTHLNPEVDLKIMHKLETKTMVSFTSKYAMEWKCL